MRFAGENMRILWLDSIENPWIEDNGWEQLKGEGIEVVKESLADHAKRQLSHGQFDLFVVRAEIPGSLELLEEIKSHASWSKVPSILTSIKWDKKEFKQHAKTSGSAKNYVRLSIPVKTFIRMLKELFDGKLPDSMDSSKAFLGLDSTRYDSSRSVQTENSAKSEDSLDKTSQILTKGTALEITPPTPIVLKKAAFEPKALAPKAPNVPLSEANVETLREYLHIRDQELTYAINEREQIQREKKQIGEDLNALKRTQYELEHRCDEAERRAQNAVNESEMNERKLRVFEEQTELEKKHYREHTEQLEKELKETHDLYENLKERVRKDIFKIQNREKELEAKLELSRKDSETLLGSRDQEILDLRRKVDALEFDIDHVQDARIKAERGVERYIAKLSRVIRTLKLALGMMEEVNPNEWKTNELQPDEAGEPIFGGAAAIELKNNPGVGGSSAAPQATNTKVQTNPKVKSSSSVVAEEKTVAPDLLGGLGVPEQNEGEALTIDDGSDSDQNDKTTNIKIS